MRAKSAHSTLFKNRGCTRNLQFGGFLVWHPACGNALRSIQNSSPVKYKAERPSRAIMSRQAAEVGPPESEMLQQGHHRPFLSRCRRAFLHGRHEACPPSNVRLARRNARLRVNGLVSDRRVPAHNSSNCDPDPVRIFASSPKTLTAFASPRVLYSRRRHLRSLSMCSMPCVSNHVNLPQ